MWKIVLLSLVSTLLVACVSGGCLPDTVFSNAKMTYYGAYAGGGQCSLDGPLPPAATHSSIYATVAAANNIYSYPGSQGCGMCLEITRKSTDPYNAGVLSLPEGKYTVFVNNRCPECPDNGIDMGLSGDGIWSVSWKAVACPVGTSKFQFKYQGSHNYYIKLQVRNTRFPVKSLELNQGGTWKTLVRQPDNFFQAGGDVTFPLSTPLKVRISSTCGDVVEDSISGIANDVIFEGTQQFPDCGSSNSGSVASTSAKVSTVTTGKSATTAAAATTGKSATTSIATTGKSATTSTTAKGTTSTTAKGTTSTTAKSSTTGTSAGSYANVFMNGFESQFQDWSWVSTKNAADSQGNSGIGYSFVAKQYEAVYFHCGSNGCINTALHSAVEFYIKSTADVKTSLYFALVQGNGGVGAKALSSFVSGSTTDWIKVTIPLTAYSGAYDGFWWQWNAAAASSTIYVDSVRIVVK